MADEQKQRALQLMRRFEQAGPMTLEADNAAVAMAALLQELIDTPEPEPVGEAVDFNGWRIVRWKGEESSFPLGTKFYTAPPAPSVPDADLVRDAERYRWLRAYNTAKHPSVTEAFFLGDENLDAEIDAAIRAMNEKGTA